MEDCITLKEKEDKIVLKIKDEAEQNEIIDCINDKMEQIKDLCEYEGFSIFVAGKMLNEEEKKEIEKIIKDEIDVKVLFDSPTILGLHGIKRTYNKEISVSETKYHKGSIRSGQRIEYNGSVVIIGDVNDGGEVIAEDNIAIIGTLRGLAHAGAKGNKDACIAASSIESPQIRISNIIKEIPRDEVTLEVKKKYAYLDDNDNIVIE